MLFLIILYRKRNNFMKKLVVPQKYDKKKLSKFILDSFPYLSPNMLYKPSSDIDSSNEPETLPFSSPIRYSLKA